MTSLPSRMSFDGLVNILAPRIFAFNNGNLGNILGPYEAICGMRYTLHLNQTPKLMDSCSSGESMRMMQETPL